MPTFNTTIKFTTAEVEKILTDYAKRELGMDADNVSFKVNSISNGYGTGEYSSYDLTGVEVSGKLEMKK